MDGGFEIVGESMGALFPWPRPGLVVGELGVMEGDLEVMGESMGEKLPKHINISIYTCSHTYIVVFSALLSIKRNYMGTQLHAVRFDAPQQMFALHDARPSQMGRPKLYNASELQKCKLDLVGSLPNSS